MEMNDNFDVSDAIPRGVNFTVCKKTYSIILNYRMIVRLSEIYGDASKAIKAFGEDDPYETTINFLYCGLRDKYNVKKADIENWIGMDLNKWRTLIFDVILKGYGKKSDSEGENEGE